MRKVLAVILILVLAGGLLTSGPAHAITGGRESPRAYTFFGAYQPGLPTPPGVGGTGCGATLLDREWLLTAAHCRKNNSAQVGTPKNWKVRLGSVDPVQGGELISVARFFRLPASNEPFWGKDLMLLKLSRPATGAPVPIASNTPKNGTTARILGWGSTCVDGGGPECYPDRLQVAEGKIRGAADCPSAEVASEICLGSKGAKAGNADSGGPLLVKEAGIWRIAGVLSGPEDQADDIAGLYTDVTAHKAWIADIMGNSDSIPDDEVDLDIDGFPALNACQAFVFRVSSSRENDPGMLMTNGHCIGDLTPEFGLPKRGADIVNRRVDAPVNISDGAGYLKTRVRATKLLYATMSGTDVAVYRLKQTYAQLTRKGVTVLTLAAEGPRLGDSVQINTDGGLTCRIEAIVPTLREGGYEQRAAVRMAADEGCATSPGSSGAAVTNTTGEVVAINSTHNRQEDDDCADNNPCEVEGNGSTSVYPHQPYAQQVAVLNGCLAKKSTFKLDRKGCALPRQ